MKLNSLDPRVSRADLPAEDQYQPQDGLNQWQTYEVFHQKSRGTQHIHVGSLHAPSPELALILAKEQYARRMKCVNLWVVRTTDVFASSYDDADMFEPATDKSYREAFGYKNKEIIRKYKAELEHK
ncbi:MAG: 1,2-phenylacetyl-CoA epoxidase subunit B [Bacteroidia bacterium]|nr:1,2-phenylacetyl-CoA epoxidase subunit B [Bacteroidia bacterium]